MGRIFPSWDDIKILRPQLTEGEGALVRLLDDHLPEAWRIYVQPYVNDMRPDVVVVNPNIGMVVIEVKDWELSRYTFENNRLVGRTLNDRWIEEDPAQKAEWYARSLYQQFLVSDEAVVPLGTAPNNAAICRAGVYFHKATTQQVKDLYGQRAEHVFKAGCDLLTQSGLRELVPYNWMPRSRFIRDPQIEALDCVHSWLVPPNHAISRMRSTVLALIVLHKFASGIQSPVSYVRGRPVTSVLLSLFSP